MRATSLSAFGGNQANNMNANDNGGHGQQYSDYSNSQNQEYHHNPSQMQNQQSHTRHYMQGN
jgi:hypothetical protein